MARTFGQLKQFVSEHSHEDSASTVLTSFLLPRWLRITHQRILQHHHWRWNEGEMQLTWPGAASGAQTSILYLPHYVDRILTMYPSSLAYRDPVEILGAWEFDRARPGSALGRGREYLILHGYYGVEADMPSASAVTFTTTGSGNVAFVEGVSTTGRLQEESVTVPNTTALTYAAGVGGVRRISLTTAGTGVVTASVGSTTIERIDASSRETTHEHQRTELYAISTLPATYTMRFYRRPREVTSDSSVIEIPHEFDDLLELGILRWLREFQGHAGEGQAYEAEFQRRLVELRAWDSREPGRRFRFQVVEN